MAATFRWKIAKENSTGASLRRATTVIIGLATLLTIAACSSQNPEIGPSSSSTASPRLSAGNAPRAQLSQGQVARQVQDPPSKIPTAILRQGSGFGSTAGQLVYQAWLGQPPREATSVSRDNPLPIIPGTPLRIEFSTSVEPTEIQLLTYREVGKDGLPIDQPEEESCQPARALRACVYNVDGQLSVTYSPSRTPALVIVNVQWYVPARSSAKGSEASAAWAFPTRPRDDK